MQTLPSPYSGTSLKHKITLVIAMALVVAICIGLTALFILHNRGSGSVSGIIEYGPTNPLGNFCSAPAADMDVVFTNSSGTKYQTKTDSSGHYYITLPVGDYAVTTGRLYIPLISPVSGTPETSNHSVTIVSGKTTTYNGCFDTGIR